jgi:hypothetical protein
MHVQGQWGIGRDSRVSGNVSDGDVLTLYFTSLGESHEIEFSGFIDTVDKLAAQECIMRDGFCWSLNPATSRLAITLVDHDLTQFSAPFWVHIFLRPEATDSLPIDLPVTFETHCSDAAQGCTQPMPGTPIMMLDPESDDPPSKIRRTNDDRPVHPDPVGTCDPALVGLKGCVAESFAALGVFDSSEEAWMALDKCVENELVSRRESNMLCLRQFVCDNGSWCPEVLERAATNAGFGMREIPRSGWHAAIAGDKGLLIDGVINSAFLELDGQQTGTRTLYSPAELVDSSPDTHPREWRHTVASMHGRLYDKPHLDRIDRPHVRVDCLWMSEDGSVDRALGYLRNVYRVWALVPTE